MGDNDEVVHAWEEDRPCCNSQFNCWHARPCAVNGPTGSSWPEWPLGAPVDNVVFEGELDYARALAERWVVNSPLVSPRGGPYHQLRVDRTFENETRIY